VGCFLLRTAKLVKNGASPESRSIAAGRPRLGHWLALLQNLLGAAIVLGFLWYLWLHRSRFAAVLDVSIFDLGLLTLLALFTKLATSTQAYVLYRASGIEIGFFENLVLALATHFGNYLPMRFGTLLRARYLKAAHGLRYARFGGISTVRTLLVVIATGLFGLGGTVGVALLGGRLSVELLASFGALAALPLAALGWRPPKRRAEPGRLLRIWYDFSDGLTRLRSQPGVSLQVMGLVLVEYASLSTRFLIASHAMGAQVSISMLVLLAPLAALANSTALTPGGFGARETLMGYVTYATGTSFAEGAFVGALDRAVLLGIDAVGGTGSFLRIWTRIRAAPAPR